MGMVARREDTMKTRGGGGAGVLGLVALVSVPSAQTPTAVPIYTAAQATAGRVAYDANCASCHLPDLAGRNEAPPLRGANFMNTWRARTAKDLLDYMQATMPPGRPSLAPEAYLSIAAFVLQSNGAAAGSQNLTASVTAAIGSVATGQAPARAAAPAGAAQGPARAQGPPPPRGLRDRKSTRLNSSHG